MNRTCESTLTASAAVGIMDLHVADAAHSGLMAHPKYLPSWLFYDAAGSSLFDRITELPEYYLTRLEREIFERHAAEILATAAGNDRLTLVELGAGNASKTLILLRALVAHQGAARYVPVDVSAAALSTAQSNVHRALPRVDVQPVQAEYMREMPLNGTGEQLRDGRSLVLYIGSSIGNFDPLEASDLLQRVREQLQPGDAILLGTDMVKAIPVLLDAYNDAEGITAAFNKNVLTRLNRELAADFDLDAFEHRAIWNQKQSRMEMHLISHRRQKVRIQALELEIAFDAEETIHTENSYKFTPGAVQDMLEGAGFVVERSWYDPQHWFGVHLARVTERVELPLESGERVA